MANRQTCTRRNLLVIGLLGATMLLIVGSAVVETSSESWRLANPAGEVIPSGDIAEPLFQVRQITIVADGEKKRMAVRGVSVAEALAEVGLHLGDLDRVEPSLDSPLEAQTVITVTRVTTTEAVEYKRLAFREVRRANTSVNRGVTRVLQAGREGRQAIHYQVTLENGVEVSRTQVRTEVLQPQVDRVVEYGTVGTLSRGGVVLRYSKVIYVTATAYTSGYESTGKRPGHPQYGITFSGLPVQVGHIAVDRSVIPLLSSVYIEGLCEVSRGLSGQYLATDIGSAIRGNRIDIFFESLPEALRFGRRRMRVFLLTR
ncbi:MAG: Cell wall-binding protein YocH [Firmicutes bacterium]|nr:Cell wall-binding protein YocH [Bacillota bacterium]